VIPIFGPLQLLYKRRYTIDGARRYLTGQKHLIDEITLDLKEILDLLEKGGNQ
jgi:hypothetical protein